VFLQECHHFRLGIDVILLAPGEEFKKPWQFQNTRPAIGAKTTADLSDEDMDSDAATIDEA
jgi:hypothetical protein